MAASRRLVPGRARRRRVAAAGSAAVPAPRASGAARRAAAAAAGAAVLALGAAACGYDEGTAETSTGAAEPAETAPARTERTSTAPPVTTERRETETAAGTAPSTESETSGPGGGFAPSPEPERGGAGDEEPALSLAQLTGRRGRITPPLVRVPPFIAIRVELRADDGRAYALRIGGRTLRAGGELSSASAQFPGLRPDEALRGVPIGGSGTPVRIEASAEPGP